MISFGEEKREEYCYDSARQVLTQASTKPIVYFPHCSQNNEHRTITTMDNNAHKEHNALEEQ